jgi:hypothetical protein
MAFRTVANAVNHIWHAVRRSRGGQVSIDLPFAGYTRGGAARHYADGGSPFDDRFKQRSRRWIARPWHRSMIGLAR